MQGFNNNFLWLLIFVAGTYFLLIRPQSKQKKKRQELLNNLEKGDHIVTIGGIHGKINTMKDDSIVIEIAPNVKIKINKAAVGYIVAEEEGEASKDKDKDKDKDKE